MFDVCRAGIGLRRLGRRRAKRELTEPALTSRAMASPGRAVAMGGSLSGSWRAMPQPHGLMVRMAVVGRKARKRTFQLAGRRSPFLAREDHAKLEVDELRPRGLSVLGGRVGAWTTRRMLRVRRHPGRVLFQLGTKAR